MSLETNFIGLWCKIEDEDSEKHKKPFDLGFDPDETYCISGCLVTQRYGNDIVRFLFVHPDSRKVHILDSKYCSIVPCIS